MGRMIPAGVSTIRGAFATACGGRRRSRGGGAESPPAPGRRRLRLASLIAASLAFWGSVLPATGARGGYVIKVANTTDNPQVLDDLIAYDNDGKKDTIIPSTQGNGVQFIRREVKSYYSNLDSIKSVFVSQFIDGKEVESRAIKVAETSKTVAMIEDVGGTAPVYLSADFSQQNFTPPAVGTILTIVNGVNTTPNTPTPGWFVGTRFDTDTGDITGPFTGSVEIVSDSFGVALSVPEPSSLVLLAIGAAGLGVVVRAGRRGRRGVGRSPDDGTGPACPTYSSMIR